MDILKEVFRTIVKKYIHNTLMLSVCVCAREKETHSEVQWAPGVRRFRVLLVAVVSVQQLQIETTHMNTFSPKSSVKPPDGIQAHCTGTLHQTPNANVFHGFTTAWKHFVHFVHIN